MTNYVFKLFIAGKEGISLQASKNLERFIRDSLNGAAQYEIIDILEVPDCAQEYKIIATPLLIRTDTQLIRKVIGDLSDWDKLKQGLGIEH